MDNLKRLTVSSEYIKTRSAKQALQSVGINASTESKAEKIIQSDSLLNAQLYDRLTILQDKMNISIERVVAEIASIAFVDCESSSVYKPSDKLKALEMLGKYMKMWDDSKSILFSPSIEAKKLVDIKFV